MSNNPQILIIIYDYLITKPIRHYILRNISIIIYKEFDKNLWHKFNI